MAVVIRGDTDAIW